MTTEPAADTAWAAGRAKEIVEAIRRDARVYSHCGEWSFELPDDDAIEYVTGQLLLAYTEGWNAGVARAGNLAKEASAKYYGDGPEPEGELPNI